MRLTKMCALGMLVALMAMLTLVPIAAAGDIEGKAQSVDPRTGAITLADGTKLKVMDVAKLQELKPGKSVKADLPGAGRREGRHLDPDHEERHPRPPVPGSSASSNGEVDDEPSTPNGGADMIDASPAPSTPPTRQAILAPELLLADRVDSAHRGACATRSTSCKPCSRRCGWPRSASTPSTAENRRPPPADRGARRHPRRNANARGAVTPEPTATPTLY